MRIVSRGLALFLCLVVVWTPLAADVLFLADGRQIQGSDIQVGEQTVSIVTESGVEEYPISQLDHFVREPRSQVTDDVTAAADAISDPGAPPLAGTYPSGAESPCVQIMQGILESKQEARIRSGIGSLVGGAVAGIVFAAADGFSELGSMLGLVTFAVIGVPGALSIALPSKAEKRIEDILAVQADERERTCVGELERMAEQGRRSRYVTAISNGAMALLGYGLGWIYVPTYYVVQAARAAIFPSEEEDALERYRLLAEGSK